MYVCVYVCVRVCMYVYMYVCMYGPVSRAPESVSLGDHTIGGWGPGIRSPDSYIHIIRTYICTYIHNIT